MKGLRGVELSLWGLGGGGGGGGRVEQHRPLMSRHLSLHKNFFLRDANSMAFKDMGFHSSKSFISVHTQGLVLN